MTRINLISNDTNVVFSVQIINTNAKQWNMRLAYRLLRFFVLSALGKCAFQFPNENKITFANEMSEYKAAIRSEHV